MTLALFCLFLVLQLLDVLTTHFALKRGGREANPVMRSAFDRLGFWPASALKVALAAAIAGYLLTPVPWLLAIICAGYALVVVNNARIAFRH